jgi:hypothetical protein
MGKGEKGGLNIGMVEGEKISPGRNYGILLFLVNETYPSPARG